MRRRYRPAQRAEVVTAIICGHAALYWLFPHHLYQRLADDPALAVFSFYPQPPQVLGAEPPAPRAEQRSRPARFAAIRPAILAESSVADLPQVAATGVDWVGAAERAVRARAGVTDHEPRGFWMPQSHNKPASLRSVDFSWPHASLHPVEANPGGPLVFNINDRCSIIVLTIIPIPLCSIRKPPARGDLYAGLATAHQRDDRDLPP